MSTDIDQIWKDEAIERMADNDRVILEQRDRIATLEFHLGKLRDLLWPGYTNTHGVLPLLPVKDAAPTKKEKKVDMPTDTKSYWKRRALRAEAEEAIAKQAPPAKWAWWLEGDDHCHIETTESDCHGPAHESIDSDTEPGIVCEYFIARTAHPLDAIAHDNLAFYLGESIHEDIDMRCADETGAEEESLSITDQDKIELGQLVLDFLRGRAKVQWWGVDKKTEARHTYVAGGDDDESGGVTP